MFALEYYVNNKIIKKLFKSEDDRTTYIYVNDLHSYFIDSEYTLEVRC